ncbi:MAG: hypothetical protein Kow0062_25500 [Acidobacteriota bacterium]
MLIHTFHGRTAAEALSRARDRLGEDACVLETRRTTTGIEVLVAAERPSPPGAEPPRVEDPVHALWAALHERLRAEGFAEALASRIAAAAAARVADGRAEAAVALRDALAVWLRVETADPGPGALVLVGAPGVGKTTTIAKIAAREAARRGAGVVLASMDDQRLGGLEQLEATARVLGVPFFPLRDERDLAAARRRAGRRGLLLVDTPGVSRGGSAVLDRIDALTRGVERREVELLLAADADRHAITESVRRFARLAPRCAGLTRLDEAPRGGGLLSVLVRTGLAVRHVSTGPLIPDDLARATARGLAAWAIPHAPLPSRPATAHDVATKEPR